MILLVDADGVLENFTRELPRRINERYGTNVSFEQITKWGFAEAFPSLTCEQILAVEADEELYDRIQPMPGAREYLEKLMDDGHTIYIVTNTPYNAIAMKMEKVMKKYFPFLSWDNYIITSRKQLLKGDVLIDDGIHNLLGGDYKKLLFDAPVNRNFNAEENGMIRVKSWDEIYSVISEMDHLEKRRSQINESAVRNNKTFVN